LREWRQRRHLSQLDVASRSAVSARHLSFIETGRSRPSREMVLHLAQRLDVPLRERNRLLLAAGYAPAFSEHALDEVDMTPVREAIERLLRAHEPYPALVVDRHWNIVASNRGVDFIIRGVAPELLAVSANAYRIALHPDGLAPRIGNFAEWSAHMLMRLRRELDVAPDPELSALYDELAGYPGVLRPLCEHVSVYAGFPRALECSPRSRRGSTQCWGWAAARRQVRAATRPRNEGCTARRSRPCRRSPARSRARSGTCGKG
jgi:transcriptional regulator with XRE-family HTH domain